VFGTESVSQTLTPAEQHLPRCVCMRALAPRFTNTRALPLTHTALHLATCNNCLEVIPFLVSLPHVDMNPLDHRGSTPLDDAVRCVHHDVINDNHKIMIR
jgi:hypothetical protein